MPATTLTDRAVVRLSGEDVREFLQGLVTQDVARRAAGVGRAADAQGKCLFDFLVWADGGDLLLDCEAQSADDLIKRLSIYRLRRPIKIERDHCAGCALVAVLATGGRRSAPARAWPAMAGAGRANPGQAGWSTASGLACAKGGRSWTTCSGWNATRPSLTESASARAASSGRKTPRG